jgi:hypothetical protein
MKFNVITSESIEEQIKKLTKQKPLVPEAELRHDVVCGYETKVAAVCAAHAVLLNCIRST